MVPRHWAAAIRRMTAVCLVLACSGNAAILRAQTDLNTTLLEQSPERLAELAFEQGDATRGAILFHQPHLQCAGCHATGKRVSLLGPNLDSLSTKLTRPELIEALLLPSKAVREGYEAIVAITLEGETINGVLQEETPSQIVVLDASEPGRKIVLKQDDLDEWMRTGRSVMPDGLVNLLANEAQFYDLARYVIEIVELGVDRAQELEPPAALTQLPPLPEYEAHVDHAGLLRDLDQESLRRGSQIYGRVCSNCHGTLEREGSLPTAPRFGTGTLKNGHDPWRMYQTLTHGHGMMVAQRWMVPQQKYDVIHYIRETYFRPHNTALYTSVDDGYLSKLPAGDTRGPEPISLQPWITMDYGPSMIQTFEIALNNTGDEIGANLGREPKANRPWDDPDPYFGPGQAPNFAYKGIAVRLDTGAGGVTRGTSWMVYDHDTMNLHAGWDGRGFIDFCNIQFDGRHACHCRLVGEIRLENPVGPGWADPETGSFVDPRPLGRDGRAYGPLPRPWLRYRGLYHYNLQTILAYSVGEAIVHELPAVTHSGETTVFLRHLRVSPSPHDLVTRTASDGAFVAVGGNTTVSIEQGPNQERLVRIPAHTEPIQVVIAIADQPISEEVLSQIEAVDFEKLTSGGPARWPERIETPIELTFDDRFSVDNLTLPRENPWLCQVRPTGVDFFADGKRAAMCTWDGDVWIVSGIDQDAGTLTWQRIASGLFQPLGLKIIDDQIYLTCRDQLAILRDLNGDGETDYYECFNNDHQVTEHFHEFAMGLQADADGNFYYAKSARHAKRAVVPHHGTLLRVSADGTHTDIVATGFRAANGVCINSDGSFYVTDQEGHWTPKNRINRVTEGGFYGNMYGYHEISDSSDTAMLQPLCWITNDFDRSPAELLWVPDGMWGNLSGSLLNLSYGYGQIFVVPHEQVAGTIQGGMSPLPIPRMSSGLIRGRFHPNRRDLFACGMFAWAGSQQEPGIFVRVRYNGQRAFLPVHLAAAQQTLTITFSDPLDPKSSQETQRFRIQAWDLNRTANYGSRHLNQRELKVEKAQISEDGLSVTLTVPDLVPTWGMSIDYELIGADDTRFEGEIHNSIHTLPASEGSISAGTR